ncbi:hypothetical protein CAXC1_80038 [Candidatus Xenohaliotis californiensis]|uniref:Uncharacterized protein n=1 Tax=Candidatus Xenohaliotis californiensis TaxID=84677 RepID=A0ABP0EUD5_9RICK|nr:hypothetical protein CAXC1_80038 [Candidatus Xenohaliotis californiensis]
MFNDHSNDHSKHAKSLLYNLGEDNDDTADSGFNSVPNVKPIAKPYLHPTVVLTPDATTTDTASTDATDIRHHEPVIDTGGSINSNPTDVLTPDATTMAALTDATDIRHHEPVIDTGGSINSNPTDVLTPDATTTDTASTDVNYNQPNYIFLGNYFNKASTASISEPVDDCIMHMLDANEPSESGTKFLFSQGIDGGCEKFMETGSVSLDHRSNFIFTSIANLDDDIALTRVNFSDGKIYIANIFCHKDSDVHVHASLDSFDVKDSYYMHDINRVEIMAVHNEPVIDGIDMHQDVCFSLEPFSTVNSLHEENSLSIAFTLLNIV